MTTLLWIFFVLSGIILLLLMIQFHLFIPAVKGFPVLMYHKIERSRPDGLTVTTDQLEKQLAFLKHQGYQTLNFKEIWKMYKAGLPIPARSLVLTFDDAYENYQREALPLLRKYGFRATLFVPVGFMGKINEWDGGHEPLLNPDSLLQIAGEGLTEIGLHSMTHRNFRDLTPEEVLNDLKQCHTALEAAKIPYTNVLAYPYGAYPRKDPAKKEELFRVLSGFGVLFAMRIGNRLNRWPLKSRYEITRTDIRGTDSFFTFKTKVKKGRSKLFA